MIINDHFNFKRKAQNFRLLKKVFFFGSTSVSLKEKKQVENHKN